MSARARHDPWFAKTPDERAHEWQSEVSLAALLGVKAGHWDDGWALLESSSVLERRYEWSVEHRAPDDDEPPLQYRLREDVPLESAVVLAMLEREERHVGVDFAEPLKQLANAQVPQFNLGNQKFLVSR